MNDRLLVDTNVVIYALQGLQHVRKLVDQKSVFVSFVTEVELLSHIKSTSQDLKIIGEFLERSHIIEYSIPIKEIAIEVRRKHKLKLADAFMAATAIEYSLPLVSADPVFGKVAELNFFKINP